MTKDQCQIQHSIDIDRHSKSIIFVDKVYEQQPSFTLLATEYG